MTEWWVIVPVRGGTLAKSRLAQALPLGEDRAALAEALAADVVTAASRAPCVKGITIVTGDVEHCRYLAELGAEIMAEPVGTGLDGAVTFAASEARRAHPGLGIAILMGDIPGATPLAISEALAAAEQENLGVLSDQDGTGTVLLTARPTWLPQPSYGAGSFARHVAAGHRPLSVSKPCALQHDLDTLEDLREALIRGFGIHAAQAFQQMQCPR